MFQAAMKRQSNMHLFVLDYLQDLMEH
jgi:hypothetical protein